MAVFHKNFKMPCWARRLSVSGSGLLVTLGGLLFSGQLLGDISQKASAVNATSSDRIVKDYSVTQIKGLLLKVSSTLDRCEGKIKSSRLLGDGRSIPNTSTHRNALTTTRVAAPEAGVIASTKLKVCGQKKLLLAMRSVLEAYLSEKVRYDLIANRSEVVAAENATLKHSLQSERAPASVNESTGCYKQVLLKQLMIANGVNANGGSQYSKLPLGPNATCWSNSKNKKEASVTLCNFPLAINVQTKGGTERIPTTRKKEYIFSMNQCDLITVRTEEKDANGDRETYLNYDQCLKQWNKRTADAAMTPSQVALMEDTIGFCFREHLLPARTAESGRRDPQIRRPAAAPQAAPKVLSISQ